MFILTNAQKLHTGKYEFDILDTDDLVCERHGEDDLRSLFRKVPSLQISGLTYDAQHNIFNFVFNAYGNKLYTMGNDYALFVMRRAEFRAKCFYDVLLYKRGVDKAVAKYKTPFTSKMDYLQFDMENDKGVFKILARGYDKHYYREDCGEYFVAEAHFDIRNGFKCIREDKHFFQEEY